MLRRAALCGVPDGDADALKPADLAKAARDEQLAKNGLRYPIAPMVPERRPRRHGVSYGKNSTKSVIASEAKQSRATHATLMLRRCAPRNDEQ